MPLAVDDQAFVVKADGVTVSREDQLLAVTITTSVNRISTARLAYVDGSASDGDFPLSSSSTFEPGTAVEVLAGPSSDYRSLFTGIVVKQALKVRDHSATQLVIECRHNAVKLTIGRKSAYFADATDSDIILGLLSAASVEGDVTSTSEVHQQQVQYRSTDWDYLLARSEANGMLVLTNDGKLAVTKPDFSSRPAVDLHFGATLLELDVEVDARLQQKSFKAFSWDQANQNVVEHEAVDPGVSGPGNMTSSELAEVGGPASYDLKHGAASEGEIQAWADSERLRAEMNRVSGRAKCEGIGTVIPGARVSLGGVGERFNGDAFVTGVRHDFDLVQGWKTHVQFGGIAERLAHDRDVSMPKAGGLIPGVSGLQIGVVTANEDPAGEHRVRVRMPLVDVDDDGTWARVASLDAGDDRGFFFRPELGDEVVVGFLDDDPRAAVVLGMLHSSAKAAPLAGSDDNHQKLYQSRSKMKLSFDDDTKVMSFETPAGNKISLSEDKQGIFIQDQSGNKIEMTAAGIKIESVAAIELKAATSLTLDSGTGFEMSGGSTLTLKGASSVELSSSGITSVKGSLVQIN